MPRTVKVSEALAEMLKDIARDLEKGDIDPRDHWIDHRETWRFDIDRAEIRRYAKMMLKRKR